ncbi:MAG: metal-dependent transcriptional regulator [Chloroflexota bacterium]|nr:metal-dependent transcriptional regulator [Chloroflexota bacterium]
MEDYLKAIHRLQQSEGRVTTQALATELSLSAASVTNMVKRLAELSLLEHSRYYGVRLTETGIKVALEVIRHHRLLELYLAEAMGYDWDKVHEEAERLEHHVSSEFESRMDELLGHPEYDPHGDPIPTLQGELPSAEWHALTDEPAGSRVILRRVSDRDADDLRFLNTIGLIPGVRFLVLERTDEGGLEMEVQLRDRTYAIPERLAAGMQVERVDESG